MEMEEVFSTEPEILENIEEIFSNAELLEEYGLSSGYPYSVTLDSIGNLFSGDHSQAVIRDEILNLTRTLGKETVEELGFVINPGEEDSLNVSDYATILKSITEVVGNEAIYKDLPLDNREDTLIYLLEMMGKYNYNDFDFTNVIVDIDANRLQKILEKNMEIIENNQRFNYNGEDKDLLFNMLINSLCKIDKYFAQTEIMKQYLTDPTQIETGIKASQFINSFLQRLAILPNVDITKELFALYYLIYTNSKCREKLSQLDLSLIPQYHDSSSLINQAKNEFKRYYEILGVL